MLRRHTLNLLAGLSALAWVVAGPLLRVNLLPIFDCSPFLALPIGFRTFFGLRVAVGLSGLWTLIFGPAVL